MEREHGSKNGSLSGGSPGLQPSGAGQPGSSGDEACNDEQEDPSSSGMLPLHHSPKHQQQDLEDDLKQFREKWRQEVSQTVTSPDNIPEERKQTTAYSSTTLEKAVSLYMAGMRLEQQGQLYEATQQYRRAVQLEPAVEETVRHLLLTSRHRRHSERHLDSHRDETLTEPESELDSGSRSGSESASESEPEPESDNQPESITEKQRVLAHLQQMTLDSTTFCQPALPHTGLHISCLPVEVMQLILRWVVSADVDVRSLEMLGFVSRGLYLLSRDSTIWKRICYRVLGAGYAEAGPLTIWRELYLSRPHLHFSGCYISRASYIRSGELNGYQDTNYRPWHMVRYYRYLRLFPEGVLLMMTTTDEPAVSVAQLMPRPASPYRAPTVPGHWRLKGDLLMAVLSKPRDAGCRSRPVRSRRRDREPYDAGHQTMHLELEVLPVRGGTFQLAWHSYKIVTRYLSGRESSHAVDLNDQFPPLSLSRVRSYTAVSQAPLR